MEDPVIVMGTQVTQDQLWCFDVKETWAQPTIVKSHLTYVKVPGTDRYILNIERPEHPTLNACSTWSLDLSPLYEPQKAFVSMSIPRSIMVRYIHASTEFLKKNLKVCEESKLKEIRALDVWKKMLVLEGLCRCQAARTIQRQFREAMANPAYFMCQKRLLREFQDNIAFHQVFVNVQKY